MEPTGATEEFGTWIVKGYAGVFDEEPIWRSEPCNNREELDAAIMSTEPDTAPNGPLKAFELERVA